jgi:hypothetical protein
MAENLGDAWSIALRVNQQLQSQQALSAAAGWNLKAAQSDRWPTLRSFTFNSFLTVAPQISSSSFFGVRAGAGAGEAPAAGAAC